MDANDNELAYLEAIHFFVEVLDQFFGNVCELDLVFNFYKVCFAVLAAAGWFDHGRLLMPSRYTLYLTKSSSLARLRRRASKSF